MKNVLIKVTVGAKWLGAMLLLTAGVVFLSSCRSTGGTSSSSFASVVISGNTPGQIRNAAVEVFTHEGYTVRRADPGNLVFEKEGGKMNDFAYGSWIGDTPVWIRVKATVVPLGEMSCRLQCHAYIVRDRGSAAEEELKVSRLHKGQYQKLLDKVAASFGRS